MGYLVMFCCVLCVQRKKEPKKWRLFFIAFLILGITNIIFCAVNLSILVDSNLDIMIMALVQTGLVLGFTIICTFCCLFCQFCTDLGGKNTGTNVNVQLNQQQQVDREARILQRRMENMMSMYQTQLLQAQQRQQQ